MENGYPEENDFELIKNWDIHDPRGVFEFLQEIWWAADWGFHIKRGRDYNYKWVMRINMSTGGWSGNEEIISVMKETMLWMLYWTNNRRGGHYTFEIPIKVWKDGFN